MFKRTLIALLVVGGLWIGASASYFIEPDAAVRALEAQGFVEIELKEKTYWWVSFRGCGSSDSVKFEFAAYNVRGNPVNVIVCDGWFKGATVRFE